MWTSSCFLYHCALLHAGMVSFGSTAAASAYVLILDSDLSPGHELECDKESSDAEMDGAE